MMQHCIFAIKKFLLSIPVTRELLFFLFQKKVYKTRVDKKIHAALAGRYVFSNKIVDNLIVSLTSFPERIDEIKYTIFSLLDQRLIPEKIILWLADSQFPGKEKDLPEELLAFTRFNFEIRWCENLRSYKKLIPALKAFPEYFIVTADDDIYYNKRWLEKLWHTHIKYPDHIVCHIAAKIRWNSNDLEHICRNWKKNVKETKSSFLLFPVGAGGVLVHKKLLFEDICNQELFSALAPNADDIWFYFMAILNDSKIHQVKNPCRSLKYVNPYREYGLRQGYKLSDGNVTGNQNDVQFYNVLTYYKMQDNPILTLDRHG